MFHFNEGDPIGDGAICLPWDKSIVLTPDSSLQRVLLKLTKEYIWRCPSMSLPPGTDTETMEYTSTVEPFVLLKQPGLSCILLRVMPADGGHHASATKQNLCHVLCSVCLHNW